MEESNDSSGDEEANPNDDAQPTTKLISKIQAPELLGKIIQFVPKETFEASAATSQDDFSAKNAEIKDIRVLSQFKLRYLCRRFRNIIQWKTPMELRCYTICPRLHVTDRAGVQLSRAKTLDQLTELAKLAPSKELYEERNRCCTLADNIGRLKVCFDQYGVLHSLSIPAFLRRITEVAKQPCLTLSLELGATDKTEVGRFFEDFGVPLKRQFPSLKLEELRVLSGDASDIDLDSLRPVVKHLLEFGQQSLVKLHVNVFVLMSLLAAEARDEEASACLPEDWTCATLQTLSLDLEKLESNHYDYDSEISRAALVTFYANLSNLFPNLKQFVFSAHEVDPKADFSALRNLDAGIVAMKLGHVYPTAEQGEHLMQLLRSSNVSSLNLASYPDVLSKMNVVLPRLTSLKYHVYCFETDALDLFKRQLETVRDSFASLRELAIRLQAYSYFPIPPYADFISLLRSLHRLSNLTSIRFENCSDFEKWNWCPAGDLSIVQHLPPTVIDACIMTMRPASVSIPPPAEDPSDRFKPCWSSSLDVPSYAVEEDVYKLWLHLLLYLVSKHPSLERFYCLCAAARFEVLLELAEKWNKCAASAVADLGLICVVHVQCTPMYGRMLESRMPRPGDRLRFRFVLAPRQKLPAAGDNAVKPKRRTVTVDFHNL